MKWLLNLFNNKSQEKSESNRKWIEGYNAYKNGKELYLKRQHNDALYYLDKAIENGFEDDVFDLRAGCLQELEYHYEAIADFNKAIVLSPKDCNKYFSRSVSKGAIKDYQGEIDDLRLAIELSKEDSELNRAYDDEAKKIGHRNGITSMLQMRLVSAEMNLEFEENERNRMQSATPEMKLILEEIKSKRVNVIKLRNQ